jgi:hypothetical protein
LYTDFFAGSDLFFELVKGAMGVHAGIFVEVQGAGQIFRIHTKTCHVFAAPIEFSKGAAKQGKTRMTACDQRLNKFNALSTSSRAAPRTVKPSGRVTVKGRSRFACISFSFLLLHPF